MSPARVSGSLFGAFVKKISEFHSRVLPHLPGCSIPLANQAILDAAIQFCEASMAIRETLDPMLLESGLGVYDFEAPSQQEVVRVMRARIDGRDLRLEPASATPSARAEPGQPVTLHTSRNESQPAIVLTPAPDVAYELSLEVALRPTRSATMLSDDLFILWLDAIVAGAVGAAQRTPGQPFSDPLGALQRQAEFRSHISRARINASMGQVKSTQRVRARPLA